MDEVLPNWYDVQALLREETERLADDGALALAGEEDFAAVLRVAGVLASIRDQPEAGVRNELRTCHHQARRPVAIIPAGEHLGAGDRVDAVTRSAAFEGNRLETGEAVDVDTLDPIARQLPGDGRGIETTGGVTIPFLLLLDVIRQIGGINRCLRRVGERGPAIAGKPGAIFIAVPDDVRRRAGNGEVAHVAEHEFGAEGLIARPPRRGAVD